VESRINAIDGEHTVTREHFLTALVDSSISAIIGKRLDGTIATWNQGAENLLGYSEAESTGKPISIIIPDELLEEAEMLLAEVCAGRSVRDFETKRRRKDGAIIEVSLTLSPVFDGDVMIGACKVIRAITEREAHAASVDSHLASIVESSDDIIISKDLTGKILSWNKGAERVFGYTAEETIGQPISLIMPQDRLDDMVTILATVGKGGRVQHFETQRLSKDGRLLDVSLTVSPIYNDRGEIVGASKIGKDITEAKRAQRELHEKAIQLQTLYDAGSTLGRTLEVQPIYENMRTLVARVMDCDGLIVNAYNSSDELIRSRFAWIEGQVTSTSNWPPIPLAPAGKGLQSSVIRTGRSMLINDVEAALANTKTSYRVDPDGSITDEPDPDKPQTRSMLLVPIKLEAEVIGVVQLVSHRLNAYTPGNLELFEGLVYQMAAAARNAELFQRVKESEAQFRLMANAMPQIAWSLDSDGTLDFLNARFTEYSGYSAKTDPGDSWVSIVHPEDRPGAMERYKASVSQGRVWEQELRLRRNDGEYRWHLSRLVPVRESGRIIRWFGAATDIHEKKEAEDLARREGEALRASREELKTLNAALEQRVAERTAELVAANKELEGFTYSVSHDLRSPLRSIMSSSIIVLEDFADTLPDEAQAHLRRQAAAAKKLAALIDDLLQYSRLGRKAIEPQEVSLTDIALAISEDVSRRNPDRDIEWKIAPGLRTHGDANLLTMLLQNLLDNAFKFTRSCETAIIEFSRDEQGFFVRDNGVGFDMQYVDKLFRPFERLHRESEYAGTGIGLANVKRVVERHGGRIWAEGVPDDGASFHFILPD
jgi:PAS domain S-box-containing protein